MAYAEQNCISIPFSCAQMNGGAVDSSWESPRSHVFGIWLDAATAWRRNRGLQVFLVLEIILPASRQSDGKVQALPTIASSVRNTMPKNFAICRTPAPPGQVCSRISHSGWPPASIFVVGMTTAYGHCSPSRYALGTVMATWTSAWRSFLFLDDFL